MFCNLQEPNQNVCVATQTQPTRLRGLSHGQVTTVAGEELYKD